MEAEIKVVIVEDTEVLRDSLTMLLKGSHGFNLIGVYENAEDALLHLPNLCPDVVLMDIGLPGINGIECIKQLEGKCPNTQFLICTIYEEDEYVFEALKAGATGYILKNSSPAMILDSIIELHKGGAPMSRLIARKVIQTMQKEHHCRQTSVYGIALESLRLNFSNQDGILFILLGFLLH